tara:strand:+ start:1784 stop:2128 length:345 start_codon:yes stop_codon:yes gene_type:complete
MQESRSMSGEKEMTASQYDVNGNGKLDPEERAMMLEDHRMRIEDDNAQRDQSRKMIWWVLGGMLGYPFFVIGSSFLGLSEAATILGSMATIYFPATSLILGAFFGANAYQAKKD